MKEYDILYGMEHIDGDLVKAAAVYKGGKKRKMIIKTAAVAVAIAAVVSATLMLPAFNKTPAAPVAPEEQASESSVVTDEQAETNEPAAETKPEITVTDEQTVENTFDTQDRYGGKIRFIGTAPNYFNHTVKRLSGNMENDIIYGREIPIWKDNKYTYETGYSVEARICPHEDIKEYEVTYSRTENYNDNKAYMLVIPSESIELLSDDFVLLNFDISETCKTKIKFRYKEGYTNGKIELMVFKEDTGLKLYAELDKHIIKNGLGNLYENDYDFKNGFAYLSKVEFCIASIKGYDFEQNNYNTRLNWIYTLAAEYFGDVDDTGKPLFESDPYMPEYYDGPRCWNDRYTYEKWYNPANYSKETRGESTTPLSCFVKGQECETNN